MFAHGQSCAVMALDWARHASEAYISMDGGNAGYWSWYSASQAGIYARALAEQGVDVTHCLVWISKEQRRAA
jgi:hypothetical protein